jgi:membrane fusion protein, multidrug efflux system
MGRIRHNLKNMKRSTKTISLILIFFLIIATVIIGRTMIGNHFKKKFSKRPPPGIIVTEVVKKEFSEKIETFGTAISKKSETFKIKKDDLFEDLKLKNFIKKGEILIRLKSGNIIAPFSGVLGYTGLTEDILVSNNIVIITLDDNSIIYSDIKIPESYSASIKKGLPVEVKLTRYKDKIFEGKIDFVSSRINADTRSLLSRIKVDNKDLELISGSLLEVAVKFNLRNSLSVPDTSVMIEGDKSYVYKIDEENVANKTEVKTGIRTDKSIEIISGLTEGDIIAAEGLKKVRPLGKIKPINK